MHKRRIRPLAVALIKRDGKIFVGAGSDEEKKEKFYRLMGGGIKFRETARQALKREFREEFAAELKNIRLLEIVENIFKYNNDYGHEICYVYSADFVDEKMYEDKKYPVLDSKINGRAEWLKYNESLIVYPSINKDLLKK